jgi:hypothetical protein
MVGLAGRGEEGRGGERGQEGRERGGERRGEEGRGGEGREGIQPVDISAHGPMCSDLLKHALYLQKGDASCISITLLYLHTSPELEIRGSEFWPDMHSLLACRI